MDKKKYKNAEDEKNMKITEAKQAAMGITIFLTLLIIITLMTAPWVSKDLCYNVLLDAEKIQKSDNLELSMWVFGRHVTSYSHLVGTLEQKLHPNTSEDVPDVMVWGITKDDKFLYFARETTSNETITEYQFVLSIIQDIENTDKREVRIKGHIMIVALYDIGYIEVIDLISIDDNIDSIGQSNFYVSALGTVSDVK